MTLRMQRSSNLNISYMIDTFTRQTGGVLIRDKKLATVVHNLILHWVSVYGCPARLWSDVGGEFNNARVYISRVKPYFHPKFNFYILLPILFINLLRRWSLAAEGASEVVPED